MLIILGAAVGIFGGVALICMAAFKIGIILSLKMGSIFFIIGFIAAVIMGFVGAIFFVDKMWLK